MLLEIIAADLKDVHDLNQTAADRIELCGEMDKDGLTPEYELIREAVQVSEVPVNVMIRPHDDTFSYTDEEVGQMIEDINFVKELGANGIVTGIITDDHMIDTASLARLVDAAGEMEITFHKAFDEIGDQMAALEVLSKFPQIRTVLTSGGPASSADNIEQLKQLVIRGKELGITVMPGGGINMENVLEIVDTAAPEAIHFGTGVRVDGSFGSRISGEKIAELKRILGD
ncbi:hypothetical protein WN59_09440 [Salinicoccus sediminis]|uniref:PF03932 family protein CutC n=1 Tax=Salinicoccus sediminis TaxID=1432562 RepID=A0A0M2SHU3_9STAP|nr:copper homeostasis protein CutC [Salinicoccus sediminis]KKK33828.1 hypothetical protein WN59_09440 [Salinicoccus sediminis]